MRAIFKFALEHATITADDIIRAVELLNNEGRSERLIEAILNLDVKREDLATRVDKGNGVICTLENFNYLENEVYYKCIDVDTRYFKTQEEADTYASTGKYNYNNSNYNKNDEYTIAGIYRHEAFHWASVSEWQNWMKNELTEDSYEKEANR